MFLDELLPEEQEAFLELASQIGKKDGKLSIYESSIIEKYKKEMRLENYLVKGLPLYEILDQFKSERSKNIVLTELLQLIYSDGVFQDEERESVRLIKTHFGFEPNEYESFKDWIMKIQELSETAER